MAPQDGNAPLRTPSTAPQATVVTLRRMTSQGAAPTSPQTPLIDSPSQYASLHQGFRPKSGSPLGLGCWVFFELWSNWTPVLEAQGMTILGQTSLQQNTSLPIELELPRQVSLILGVGSEGCMHEVWAHFSADYCVIVALSLGEKPSSLSPDWHYVRHKDCDGVTSGGWWCRASMMKPSGIPKSPSVRRLRHIVSPVPAGQKYRGRMDPEIYPRRQEIMEQGASWEGSFCKLDGLLPIQRLDVKLICPSIYGGQVVRSLTPAELMDCLDITNELREDFIQCTPQEYCHLPFSRTVPTKVLAALLDGTPFGTTHSFLSQGGPSDEVRLPSLSEVQADESRDGCLLPVVPSQTDTSGLQSTALGGIRQKAAKNDNAAVEFEFWNGPFLKKLAAGGRSKGFLTNLREAKIGYKRIHVLDVLRGFLLRVWRRSVHRSLCRYMRSEHGAQWFRLSHPDVRAGRDCLTRSANATFWDWSAGSRLFFWRWPLESRIWARDGHPVYITGDLPSYRRAQPKESDPNVREKVKEKLEKFIDRGYVANGKVNSLISYFAVPKGESDVRLVFDGTKSGLNAALWAPSFHLPTVDSLLPALTPGCW